jgi:Zn finger protein HypA/HybF involved in hydrogenase expression
MLNIHFEIDENTCFKCGKPNRCGKHIRYHKYEDEPIKRVEFVFHCNSCRSRMNKVKQLREREEALNKELLELEYELFLNTY